MRRRFVPGFADGAVLGSWEPCAVSSRLSNTHAMEMGDGASSRQRTEAIFASSVLEFPSSHFARLLTASGEHHWITPFAWQGLSVLSVQLDM